MARRNVPEIVEHVVAALMRKRHMPRETAWAVAVKSLQNAGILRKGTLTLTKKGRSANARHLREPKALRRAKVKLATGK